MKACILNSSTLEVENIIELSELELQNFVPYKPGIQLAHQHDGEIGWIWHVESESWIAPREPELTTEQKATRARELRDKYLRMYVDTINAVRWESLTSAQQISMSEYRQQLLDVPDQPGFPEVIEWPSVPDIN